MNLKEAINELRDYTNDYNIETIDSKYISGRGNELPEVKILINEECEDNLFIIVNSLEDYKEIIEEILNYI